MGTNNIAELPNNPPNVSDRMVVGSRVASDTILDEDSAAVLVNISVGILEAFNAVTEGDTMLCVAGLPTTDDEGTKASADESRAARQNKIALVILWDFMLYTSVRNGYRG